jgi:hypothetical protein
MFDSIRRAKLQREGLSCGKIRRKHQEGDMMDVLRTHPAVMIGLGVAFVAVVVVLMGFGAKVTEGLPQPGFLIYSCAAALSQRW